MSDLPKPLSDDELDLYLDGQMTDEESELVESRLVDDPRASAMVKSQMEFDGALRQEFRSNAPSVADIEQMLAARTGDQPAIMSKARSRRRVLLLIVSAIAATLAWIAVATQWNGAHKVEPFFEQRPLAMLYEESVEQGFRPYYFCEDERRFAATFQKRQDVSLYLADMPEDRRMVGLSYIGGLSRDTTAILCYVNEEPVIVFVDRAEHDNPPLATDLDGKPLRVHRNTIGELVVYEVTPFENAAMTRYLTTKSTSR